MGVTVFLPQPWGMLFASWSGRSLSHGPHRAPGAPLMRQVRLMRRAVTNHQGTALCCKDVCEAKLGMTPLASVHLTEAALRTCQTPFLAQFLHKQWSNACQSCL